MEQLGFNETDFNAMEIRKNELESSVAELNETVDMLTAQLQGRLAFKYSDPVRGFDRSKVKGLVAKLIEVKDSKHSTAMEVVAGGKLFQVVVDEAITGKALLDRGKLARRVTIIPLDKIKSRTVSHGATKQAESIASSMNATAQPAIELVGFDEEVRSAIEYVFGNTIVVDGMKAANQICDATRTRTVTLEGDVYDPSGTISGGSKNQLGTTLTQLATLSDSTRALTDKSKELDQISATLASLKATADKFDKLHTKLELSKAELEANKKHLSQTSFGVLIENKDSMTAELQAAEEECVAMEKEQREKWELYEQLKEKEVELTQQREDRLAGIEDAVKATKAEVVEKSRLAREAESLSETLVVELESLKAELHAAQDALGVAEAALEEAMQQESETQINVGETQVVYEEARSVLEGIEKKREEFSSEVVDLKRQKTDLAKELEGVTLESKKLSVAITRVQKERAGAEKAVTALLKKYPWIESEKNAFGVTGGDYDFDNSDTAGVANHLKELKAQQESLVRMTMDTWFLFTRSLYTDSLP